MFVVKKKKKKILKEVKKSPKCIANVTCGYYKKPASTCAVTGDYAKYGCIDTKIRSPQSANAK